MKKLALLLAMALLAACGGGESTTVKATQSTTPAQQAAAQNGTGTLTVNINDSTAKLIPTQTPFTQTWRRVVVTNPNLNDPKTGEVYQVNRDWDTAGPAPSLGFSLPYANGYKIEVVNYKRTGIIYSNYSAKTPLVNIPGRTYTAASYEIVSYDNWTGNFTTTTTVSLTPAAPVLPAVTYPASIPSSLNTATTYSVSADFSAAKNAFNTTWDMNEGRTPAATERTTEIKPVIAPATPIALNGPYTKENGVDTFYVLPKFYLNKSMLLTGEDQRLFYFIPAAPVDSAPVTVAGGTLTVN